MLSILDAHPPGFSDCLCFPPAATFYSCVSNFNARLAMTKPNSRPEGYAVIGNVPEPDAKDPRETLGCFSEFSGRHCPSHFSTQERPSIRICAEDAETAIIDSGLYYGFIF